MPSWSPFQPCPPHFHGQREGHGALSRCNHELFFTLDTCHFPPPCRASVPAPLVKAVIEEKIQAPASITSSTSCRWIAV